MFDCAFINLLLNEIIFVQITISKDLNHPVFNRKKIEEKSKEAINFLKGNIIDEDIELNAGFFFIFLKYDINSNKKQELFDDTSKKILNDMEKINKQFKKMTEKCEQQKLKYCTYILSTNFSNNQKGSSYTVIDPDDNDLYILLKDEIKEIDNIHENIGDNNIDDSDDKDDNVKLFQKRKYIELASSMKEIKLKNNNYIKMFYDFYVKKFGLKGKKIFKEEDKLYTFEELENVCKSLYCFALINEVKKEDDYLNVIYYDSKLIIQNAYNKEIKDFNDEYKKEKDALYFLGEEEEIKSKILKIQEENDNIFSKKRKKSV